jgi:hypothetical protein
MKGVDNVAGRHSPEDLVRMTPSELSRTIIGDVEMKAKRKYTKRAKVAAPVAPVVEVEAKSPSTVTIKITPKQHAAISDLAEHSGVTRHRLYSQAIDNFIRSPRMPAPDFSDFQIDHALRYAEYES